MEKDNILTLGLEDDVDIDGEKVQEDFDEKSLFKLNSTTVDVDSRIRANSCLKIQHDATGNFLSTKQNTWNIEDANLYGRQSEALDIYQDAKGQRKTRQEEASFNPLDHDELYKTDNFVVELSERASNEDAFLIVPAETDEV